ncbi:MAG: bifunctional enoyl-CoA hydratase/phosphate acetyltransferase [Candidatus Kapabacteria bacterium]|nr:bifunctional enoyl-CoA hydratase/phosphate acetyltransferase [Candidatus Kapabacteria bacterium]
MEIKNLNYFIEKAKNTKKKKLVVAAAEDEPVLSAISEATKENIIEPILVGNVKKIENIASELNFSLKGIEIINEENPAISCRIAVNLIREDKAQILMKGLVGTADYLRAILDKENGLRKGDLLSHIGFFELKSYHKILALTDAAQNIAPSLEEKVSIINNSVDFLRRLGIEKPKVACVAAVETVTTKMQATVDAALLSIMNRRNQIKGCIIDGPLGFDNAISAEAAHHKGIISEVAGDVDLILTPDIQSGNVLYKSFTYMAGGTVAAVILGATVPVILTSRADTDRSKLTSIALAACY